MNCTPTDASFQLPQTPSSPSPRHGGKLARTGPAWASSAQMVSYPPLSSSSLPTPSSLKKRPSQNMSSHQSYKCNFKFILCTTFDFKEDYTSVVKGGPSTGLSRPPGPLRPRSIVNSFRFIRSNPGGTEQGALGCTWHSGPYVPIVSLIH